MSPRPRVEAWSNAEKGLMLSSVILITLSAFESLATTTIMPNVVASFHADSWFAVSSGAALITNLIANVLAGGLSDALGVKKVFAWGLGLFCVGLLVSALAPHIALFVFGRLIQGLGGGFIIVPLYVLIGAIATPLHRPRYFAAFSLSWVFPSLVGPALAGIIVTYIGWRVVFGVAPLLAAFGAIPLHSVLKNFSIPSQGVAPSLRFVRLALGSGIGVFLLQISGTFTSIWAMVLVGSAGLTLSAITLPRLLPPGSFSLKRGIPALVVTRLLMMGAVTGAEVVLPLLLQRVQGWTPSSASLVVTASALSWAAGSVIQSHIHVGKNRLRLPRIGMVFVVIGLAPLTMLLQTSAPPLANLYRLAPCWIWRRPHTLYDFRSHAWVNRSFYARTGLLLASGCRLGRCSRRACFRLPCTGAMECHRFHRPYCIPPRNLNRSRNCCCRCDCINENARGRSPPPRVRSVM